MPASLNHRPELDGLRALAVLLVIGSHLAVPHLAGGWIGVDVFFVLSGYLITSILVREYGRTSSIALGRFYLRRVLRLYPALLTMFLVCAIWYQHFAAWPPNYTRAEPFTSYLHTVAYGAFYLEDFVLGYTGNPHGALGHTWSLALEEQFYLLWGPLLFLTLKRGWSVAKMAGALMVASTISLVVGSGSDAGLPLTYYRPDSRANELFLGCLLAVVLPRLAARLSADRRSATVLSLAGLGGLVGVELFSDAMTRTTLFPLEEIWAGVAAAVLITGLSVGAQPSLIARALSTWPAVSIGRISYGMYLWMVPIVSVLVPYYFFVWGWKMTWWVYALACLGAIIAVATASYFLVEKHFLKLKRFFEVVPTSPAFGAQHAPRVRPIATPASRPPARSHGRHAAPSSGSLVLAALGDLFKASSTRASAGLHVSSPRRKRPVRELTVLASPSSRGETADGPKDLLQAVEYEEVSLTRADVQERARDPVGVEVSV